MVLFKYINGRTKLKQTWWSTASETERKEANRKNSRIKKKITTKKKPIIEQ
jgi:hypothetical protein